MDCIPSNSMAISFERDQHSEVAEDSHIIIYLDFCASFEFLRFLDKTSKCPISHNIVVSPSAIASFKTASLHWPCQTEYPTFGCVKEDIQWSDQGRLTLLDSVEKIARLQLAQPLDFPVRIFVTPAWRDVVAPLFPHLSLPRFRGSFAYRLHTVEDRVLLYNPHLAQRTFFSRRGKIPRTVVGEATIDLREVRSITKAEEVDTSLDYSPPELLKILTTLSKVQECLRLYDLTFLAADLLCSGS